MQAERPEGLAKLPLSICASDHVLCYRRKTSRDDAHVMPMFDLNLT